MGESLVFQSREGDLLQRRRRSDLEAEVMTEKDLAKRELEFWESNWRQHRMGVILALSNSVSGIISTEDPENTIALYAWKQNVEHILGDIDGMFEAVENMRRLRREINPKS